MDTMIRKDFKYKKINNFLTIEERMLLKEYFLIKHRINNDFSQPHIEVNGPSFQIYGDAATDSLMLQKKELIEKESGLKLLPTYSFFRMYTMFTKLIKHSDRPACEISVTVCLDSDGTEWPIYMDGNPVYLEPGEAAIYLGLEVEHWREEFKGDYSSHIFMHYVNKDGPYVNCFMDERDFYGTRESRRKK